MRQFSILASVVLILLMSGCFDVPDTSMFRPDAPVSHDEVAQDTRLAVRVFYVEPPPDGEFRPDYLESFRQIREIVDGAQGFFVREMERHGFGRQTFQPMTDSRGRVSVTPLRLSMYADYDSSTKVMEDIYAQMASDIEMFPRSRINLFFVDISSGIACGAGGGNASYGDVWVYQNPLCMTWHVLAHEIGHAVGLHHDYRNPLNMMGNGNEESRLSPDAAKWLMRHRAFNDGVSDIVPWVCYEVPLETQRIGISNTYRLTFNFMDACNSERTPFIYDYAVLLDCSGYFPEVIRFFDINEKTDNNLTITAGFENGRTPFRLRMIGKNRQVFDTQYVIDVD